MSAADPASLQTHALADGGSSVTIGTPVWVGVGGAFVLALLAAYVLFSRSKPPTSAPREPVASTRHAPEAKQTAQPAPVDAASRLFRGLSRTREALFSGIASLFAGGKVDLPALESLEENLIRADVGVSTAERLLVRVRERVQRGESIEGPELASRLKAQMRELLDSVPEARPVPRDKPFVLLVVGVNGSGKTTTIGKLASKFKSEGLSVVLAAADTFRAAAADQLAIWAERSGAFLVRKDEGADPAAVAYAGLEHALSTQADVLIVDTAGRLQNARPLMEQLSKIQRVLTKLHPEAPHETWLVIDGTMGQNAMAQARAFHEATPLTGVIVTKLDGTAKGGMVLALASELQLPVRYLGVGEGIDDLRPFEAATFVDALL